MRFPSRAWLRSVAGQLTLLGGVFLGGLGLAVTALCLRGVFFERYAREVYPELQGRAEAAARDVAVGKGGPQRLDDLDTALDADPKAFEGVYGAWIADAALDPEGRLARGLLERRGPRVLGRLRQTLVGGNPDQRSRALDWLALVPPGELLPEAIELARHARERARRRHEQELIHRADAVLGRLSPGQGESADRPQGP